MMADLKKIDWNALKEKVEGIELDDINNIQWDNMGGWPLPGKVFFAALVFIALLVAGNIFLIADMRTALSSATAKEEQLKKDLKRKHSEARIWRPIKIRWLKWKRALVLF